MQLEMRRTCDAAPVQYEGIIEGKYFYFRARWNTWSFTVADTLQDVIAGRAIFQRWSRYGDGIAPASAMPHEEAERIIQACAREFLARARDN
jgi:hypothetical protein